MKKTQQRSKWKAPNPKFKLRYVGDRIFAVKALERDGTGPWSGHDWPMPGPNGEPGRWVNVRGQLIPCQRGIHASRIKDVGKWVGVKMDLATGRYPNPCRRLFVIELQEVYARPLDEKLIARRGRILREVRLRKTTWYDPEDIRLAVGVARNAVLLDESQRAAKRGKKKQS